MSTQRLETKEKKINCCYFRGSEQIATPKLYAKASILTIMLIAVFFMAMSQNLVINPGAELSTGWTIVSGGGSACSVGTAAATYSNWKMTPDGSANYPAAHGGSRTFFAGCNSTAPAGPFELYQDIDVSADAALIDGGLLSYAFTGYIQTPIAPQGDAGRFIVDYLDASSAVLGSSYTSAYQSYAGGSGTAWIPYTSTRAAVSGTRKVRIRLQATVATSPAINAYFDDISFTKLTALGICLVFFTGKPDLTSFNLKWSVTDAVNFSRFEVEKSTDDSNFTIAGTVGYTSHQSDYYFNDGHDLGQGPIFYRLKMIDVYGHSDNSPIIVFKGGASRGFTMSPNPATGQISVTGVSSGGSVVIRTFNGNVVARYQANSGHLLIDISRLAKGVYLLSCSNGKSLETQTLIVE